MFLDRKITWWKVSVLFKLIYKFSVFSITRIVEFDIHQEEQPPKIFEKE